VGAETFTAGITSTVGGFVSWPGTPFVVRGHLPTRPDELAVNEVAVRAVAASPHVGDTLTARPLNASTSKPIDMPAQRLRLAGIVRYPLDLAASVHNVDQVNGVAFVSPAWWAKWGDRVQPWGTQIQARLRPGARPEDVYRAVAKRWPGRFVNTIDSHDAATATVRSAIGYEAAALTGLAVAFAVAGIIFVGQALSRQARREQSDLPALRSLGLTRGQGLGAAGLRAIPMAAVAGLVAIAVAWGSSAWTPIGLGGKAEPHHGLRADLFVYCVGGVLTGLAVLAALTLPVLTSRTNDARGAVNGTRLAGAAGLPAPGVAGVGMAAARRRGGLSLWTALAGLTIATAVIVAAAIVGVSLNRLVEQPARYGARFDAVVSFNSDPREAVPTAKSAPDIKEAGVIWAQDGRIDQQLVNLVAVAGLKASQASAWTTIVRGHAPERDDEVALGAKTMRALHAHIGSTVDVQASDAIAPRRLTVVGQAVFNDSMKLDAGDGALVAPALLHGSDTIDFDVLAVRVRPGVPLEQALAPFEQSGGLWHRPTPPASVRNLERIHWLPWALATVVALLAAAALAHGLVMSVRANRGDLAVLRSLGFTRQQVHRAAGWEATSVAAAAIVLGIPLGLLVGAWGWAQITREIGVVDPAAVPPMVLVGVPVAVVTLALALSVWPGRRAAQVRPALALRAE
jgi:putative ABC transport system permease protein